MWNTIIFLPAAFCTVFLLPVSDAFTPLSSQVTVTFHDYNVRWAQAEHVCEFYGGRLLVIDSLERVKLLHHYGKDVWGKSDWCWLGLHYPTSGQNDTFLWTDCTLHNKTAFSMYARQDEPTDTKVKRCGQVDLKNDVWKTEGCDRNDKFLCETISQAECSFTYANNTVPVESLEYTKQVVSTPDLSSCVLECLVSYFNKTNCWAATFSENTSLDGPSTSPENCALYFVADPRYFMISANVSVLGLTLALKNCYHPSFISGLSTQIDIAIVNNTGTIPPETCANASSLTSTSTSTTTSTTTSTPTTTTSTSTATTSTTTPIPTTTTSTSTATTSTTTPIPTTTTSTSTATTSTTTPLPTTTTSTTTSTPTTTTTIATTTTATPTEVTTTTAEATTSTSVCKCDCLVRNATESWYNQTTEEKVQEIIERLRLEKAQLSSTVRKKTSAPDHRISSQSIGYVGVLTMVGTFGSIIMGDIIATVKSVTSFLKKAFKPRNPVVSIQIREFNDLPPVEGN